MQRQIHFNAPITFHTLACNNIEMQKKGVLQSKMKNFLKEKKSEKQNKIAKICFPL